MGILNQYNYNETKWEVEFDESNYESMLKENKIIMIRGDNRVPRGFELVDNNKIHSLLIHPYDGRTRIEDYYSFDKLREVLNEGYLGRGFKFTYIDMESKMKYLSKDEALKRIEGYLLKINMELRLLK